MGFRAADGPRRARASGGGWGRMGRRRPSQAPAPMRTTDWAGARGARGLRSRGATPGARGPSAPRRSPHRHPNPPPFPSFQWDAVEDKPSALLYAGGAVVLLWLASTVVGAVNAVPLLPKLLELVGLGYTSWFVYRYLLFKSSREELLADIEELKKKITS